MYDRRNSDQYFFQEHGARKKTQERHNLQIFFSVGKDTQQKFSIEKREDTVQTTQNNLLKLNLILNKPLFFFKTNGVNKMKRLSVALHFLAYLFSI